MPSPDIRQDPVIHRHPVSLSGWILLAVCAIGGPFFFLYPLLRIRFWGLVIFFIVLIIGIGAALRVFLLWSRNSITLSHDKLIVVVQRGFFRRAVQEVQYDKIVEVAYEHRGIFETLFRYGTLRLRVLGLNEDVIIPTVPNPPQRKKEIELCRDTIISASKETHGADVSADELVRQLRRYRAKEGAHAFEALFKESKKSDGV